MFARLRAAVLVSALLIASSLSAPVPAAASHQGLCAANQLPSNLTGQWYYQHPAVSTYFDEIGGWLTDRPLFPCEGLGVDQGWSFSAASNAQDDTTHKIYQLGIIQVAGQGGDQNYFVRTQRNGDGSLIIITSPRPSFGQRYHFKVFNDTSGTIRYSIYNSAGTTIFTYDTDNAWPTTMELAWWGWETGNRESMPGHHASDAAADLVGQYGYVNSGTIYTLHPISPLSSCPTGCGDDWPNTWMLVSGADSSIFNVET